MSDTTTHKNDSAPGRIYDTSVLRHEVLQAIFPTSWRSEYPGKPRLNLRGRRIREQRRILAREVADMFDADQTRQRVRRTANTVTRAKVNLAEAQRLKTLGDLPPKPLTRDDMRAIVSEELERVARVARTAPATDAAELEVTPEVIEAVAEFLFDTDIETPMINTLRSVAACLREDNRDPVEVPSEAASEIGSLRPGDGMPASYSTVSGENVRLELWRDYFREADGSLTCTWLVDGNIAALPAGEIPRVIGYLWQLQRTHSAASPVPGVGEDLVRADTERVGESL